LVCGLWSDGVWRFLNLTEGTHPMHVHLVQSQALRRDRYNTDGFDTVRVNSGEMVTIVATFDGYTGRYMYHCHILEHEDYDMMGPFIVMPGAALEAMDMDTPEM